MRVLVLVAAVGSAAVGGVFFAFSAFVMPALRRLPPASGVAAMQAVNVAAVRPAFMVALFGTAALCGVLAVRGVLARDEPGSLLLAGGGLLYLAGCAGLTIAWHVPLNDRLAALDPLGPGAADGWARYLARWVPANTVRALAGLAAAALLVLARGG